MLPVVSGKQSIKALAAIGYRELRQKGSHVRLACEGRNSVSVPLHDSLDRGTLKGILRKAGLSTEAFLALL